MSDGDEGTAMTLQVLEPALADIRKGRFTDALRCLRNCKTGIPSSATAFHNTLTADMLQFAEEIREAQRLISATLDSGTVSKAIQSRCYSVLGLATFADGSLRQSLRWLQKAVRLAEEDENLELVCQAQLNLVANLGYVGPIDGSVAILAEVKQNVSRLGDPHLSIRLLLHVAREEGKQGRLDRAEGRLNAARALLVSHPNSWLEGVLALDASQIAFAQSKLFEGIAHAEQALRYRVWSRAN